jgi:hypothetical protein
VSRGSIKRTRLGICSVRLRIRHPCGAMPRNRVRVAVKPHRPSLSLLEMSPAPRTACMMDVRILRFSNVWRRCLFSPSLRQDLRIVNDR